MKERLFWRLRSSSTQRILALEGVCSSADFILDHAPAIHVNENQTKSKRNQNTRREKAQRAGRVERGEKISDARISLSVNRLPFIDNLDQGLTQSSTAAVDRAEFFSQLRIALAVEPGRKDVVIRVRLNGLRGGRSRGRQQMGHVKG